MGIFLAHLDEILLRAYGGLLLRGCAFLPALYTLMGGRLLFLGDGVLLSLLLWLFLVMPVRNAGYMRLRFFALGPLHRRLTYVDCLRNGMIRVGKGIGYGALFFLLSGLFYYEYHLVDFKSFYGLLKAIGSVFGGKADLGLVLWFLLIALSFLCYAFWWRRDLYLDFRDITRPLSVAGGKTPRFPQAGEWGLCVRNLLLLLPSVLLWGWIFWRHYAGEVDLNNGAMAALTSFSSMIRRPVPGTVLLKMGVVLVLVHMPLAILRKLGNAAHFFAAEK